MSVNKKGIILLSGGLDSVVSLAVLKDKVDFELALIFDYGQKSFEKEFAASKKIAKHYGVKHKCVKLDWLKEITNTSLVSDATVPDVKSENLDDLSVTTESMKSVWVPNRNGVFINIAAAFADSYGYDCIVIGANKEEAATFSDNSEKFIEDVNQSLKTATGYEVKVLAPLIKCDKNEIVKQALEFNVPLKYINSCYNDSKKHCGKCESCNRLKRALEHLEEKDLIKELFGE